MFNIETVTNFFLNVLLLKSKNFKQVLKHRYSEIIIKIKYKNSSANLALGSPIPPITIINSNIINTGNIIKLFNKIEIVIFNQVNFFFLSSFILANNSPLN